MDAATEKLLRDRSNAKNYKPSLETEVSQNGKTHYSKRGNNI
jgi:hypothetical protein